ncbi:MAG: hypothetical protein EZS28_013395, partial [Streblomastix strix]
FVSVPPLFRCLTVNPLSVRIAKLLPLAHVYSQVLPDLLLHCFDSLLPESFP